MAKLTKLEVTSVSLTAKVKLDKEESQQLLDPAKVEAFLAGSPALAIEDLVRRRDEEIADHNRRHQEHVDAQIDAFTEARQSVENGSAN